MPVINSTPKITPLANLLRPTSLDGIIGQAHLVGPDKPIRLMAKAAKLHSIIFWGPPGVGKTTLVRALAADANANFVNLNATAMKVDDVRKIIKEAGVALSDGKQTAVFVDEIHRLSKDRQDVLLPSVEEGTIVLFGATTEKPKFAVNSTILSRCSVFELLPLSDTDMVYILLKVKHHYQATRQVDVLLDAEVVRTLINRCSGDARKLITAMEMIIEVLATDGAVTAGHVDTAIPDKHLVFDATGNGHYDLAKCFQTGIQNSDVNGVLYWMGKWIASGEDPAFICRRMLVTAFEDCASNPMAPLVAMAAHYATERIGLPECLIPMAYAAVTMAQSERNKTPYHAIQEVMNDVSNGATIHVTPNLRAGNHKSYEFAVSKTYVRQDIVTRANQIVRGETNQNGQ